MLTLLFLAGEAGFFSGDAGRFLAAAAGDFAAAAFFFGDAAAAARLALLGGLAGVGVAGAARFAEDFIVSDLPFGWIKLISTTLLSFHEI